jgi:predicted CXXCH cytochrome family protein
MSSPAPQPLPGDAAFGRLRRRLLGLATLLAAALMTVGLVGRSWPEKKDPAPPAAEVNAVPSLPLFKSPFLNTTPDARFVGADACRSCHVGPDASYRRSGMGRSMADIDLAQEPPDAAFDHAPSKRRYQVHRQDGQLWHRELLLAGQPEEVILADYPVKYVVGSGRHSRSYFVEVDGFLVESPVTWYTAKKVWGMSPGYDTPRQMGFDRAAGEGCLVCHAGQAEAIDKSLHRMHVTEAAIGCERCHGPGALHIEHHAGRQRPTDRPPGAIDHSIVNPVHLSRDLAEAVCQQCHLRASATVVGRGKKLDDFRPGLPLQDFRQDYRLEVPNAPMTVVGHVEQMHLSRCYQGSDTLSCMTCHNPHAEPRPRDRVDYYNAICLDCHRPERCTVSERRRQTESPENDCTHCHMPRSPTEIPHLAFTHHRIGIHAPAQPVEEKAVRAAAVLGVLEPFLELSRLSELDQKRSLGLGYLEVANRHGGEALRASYQQRALDLLAAVRAAGLRDPVVDASLARLRSDLGLGDVCSYAESALAHPDLIGAERCNTLFVLAEAHARQGRPADAVAALRQLTRLRRHPFDWVLLADCERRLGNREADVAALETAVRINPRIWQLQQHLAEHYHQRGDAERAAWHQRRAVP